MVPFFFIFAKYVNNNLMFPDGVKFYPDVKDGVRGYNTDAARGADTFHPFFNSKPIWSGQLNITSAAGNKNHSGSVNTNCLGVKNAIIAITYISASDNFEFYNNLKYNPQNGVITMSITSFGTPSVTRTIGFKLDLYGSK